MRLGRQTLGHFLLEHQRQPRIGGDVVQPAHQERGRDVVGQVGDDLARRHGQRRRIEDERIAGNDREPIGKARAELL